MADLSGTTTTGANLRQTGSKDAPIVAVLEQGAVLNVLGNMGNWLYVLHASGSGFVYMELVQPHPANAEAAWSTFVLAQQLNIRASPSRDSASLGVINQHQLLQVIGFSGSWLHIRFDTTTGFVSADCTASVGGSGQSLAQDGVAALAETTTPVGIAAPGASFTAAASGIQIKARLTPEEIQAARASIAHETDDQIRGDRYEELQSCVLYASQRDNEACYPNGAKVETKSGAMCNLTSLAMALSYLGISNPKPHMQYEDALEIIRQEHHLDDRTTAKGWGGVAQVLGARVSFISGGPITQGQQWWETNVRQPYLRRGSGVIMSIGGHIVRLQGMTNQGLIVDDPYGRCRLLPGEANKWQYAMYNEYGKYNQTAGEDSLWLWADVAQHTMRWVAAIQPGAAVLGGEDLPDIQDDGVVVANNPL